MKIKFEKCYRESNYYKNYIIIKLTLKFNRTRLTRDIFNSPVSLPSLY